MTTPVTLEELEQGRADIDALIHELAHTTNADSMMAITAKLQEAGARLQAQCTAFGVQERARQAAFLNEDGTLNRGLPQTQIELTPEQRARVETLTGVDLPSIHVDDPTGWITHDMPTTHPDVVEAWAIAKAHDAKRKADAKKDADAAVDAALEQLKRDAPPDVRAALEEAMRDPAFVQALGRPAPESEGAAHDAPPPEQGDPERCPPNSDDVVGSPEDAQDHPTP